MRLTDGKKTVEITMTVWTGAGYAPDWSADFFEAGGLRFNAEREAYIVDSVDYCIEQAQDWQNSTGDYSMYEPDENNMVFVEEV